MSFRSMLVLVAVLAASMVQLVAPGQIFGAEPGGRKHKGLGDELPSGDVVGFTGTGGQPFALVSSLPGVVGALELTAEQRQKIAAAAAETVQSEKVRGGETQPQCDSGSEGRGLQGGRRGPRPTPATGQY